MSHPTLPADQQTPLTIHDMNFSATVPSDITRIHSQRLFEDDSKRYDGWMHPFDGWLSRSGLFVPYTYSLFVLSRIPSWVLMVGISLVSRALMTKKLDGVNERRRKEREQAAQAAQTAGRN